MRRVRWAFRARRDFIQITDYYVTRATHYPDELLDRIDELALRLAEKPGLGPPEPNTPYHKILVRGTSYILLYKLTRRELVIARVVHAKKDWRPR